MKVSRTLQLVLLAAICATIYAAWIDLTGDGNPAVTPWRSTSTGIRPASAPPEPNAEHATSSAQHTVNLFAAPDWRFGIGSTTQDTPDGVGVSAVESQSPMPTIEVIAVWRDGRGVMVVLSHDQTTRIACDGCGLPGSLQPGERWNGYQLESVQTSGVLVTQLATGKRLQLGAT